MVEGPIPTSSSSHSCHHLSNLSQNQNQNQSRSARPSNKQRKKNSSQSPGSRRGSTVGLESTATTSSIGATQVENKDKDPVVSINPKSTTLSNQGEISSIFWLSICLVFSYFTFTILSYYNSKNLLQSLNDPNPLTTTTTTITSLSNYNLDQNNKQQNQHQHLFESISSLPSTPPSSSPSSNLNPLLQDQKSSRHHTFIYPISKLFNLTLSNSMRSSGFFSSFLSLGKTAPSSHSAHSKSFLSSTIKNDAAPDFHDWLLDTWMGSFAMGFRESFKKLAQVETILLIGLCFFTLALIGEFADEQVNDDEWERTELCWLK